MDNVLFNFVSKIFLAKKVYINLIKQRVTYKQCTFLNPPPGFKKGDHVDIITISCTEKYGGRVYIFQNEKDKTPLPIDLHIRAVWHNHS